jgi:predicted GH43/DUF377 family glycosyl hydrolase
MKIANARAIAWTLAAVLFTSVQVFAGPLQKVKGLGLTATVSSKGEIVALAYGTQAKERPVRASLQLSGCHRASPSSTLQRSGNVLSWRTRWISDRDSSACVVQERIFPVGRSIRWEAEIRGIGAPWSAPIVTQFSFPDAPQEKLWAPWGDPKRGAIARMTPSQQAALGVTTADTAWSWSDPLVAIPFVHDTLWFGAPAFSYENPGVGFIPFQGNLISIPLMTVLESGVDDGLSIALSPEDRMLDLRVVTDEKGTITFSRLHHRITDRKGVTFALDLVPHEADWRGGLRWMTERYPSYFDPVIPEAHMVAGTAAYSAHETAFDTAKMKKMAFGVNWKASFDFPYMGMFLAPVKDDTTRWTRYGGGPTSVENMRQYSAKMRALGFHVLSYFNVTEFGANVIDPAPPRKAATEADLWQDCNDYLYTKLAGAILPIPAEAGELLHSQNSKDRANGPYYTWGDGIAMDPGDPAYQRFLLDQARQHIEKIPDASGICIDRMDWLRMYNENADDSMSWFGNTRTRSLLWSWHDIMERLGPLMHKARKVIFVNNHDKRIDLLNHVDGFYDEFGQAGSPLNLTAFMGIRRPVLEWTAEEKNLRPDPDVFFQKYLHMGAFPTAPYPGNDHSLQPNDWVDKQYLDYGPLLQTMRGKKWVLAPHCVDVAGTVAKVNLFEVPGGWVLPVTFGPADGTVTVRLRHVPGLSTDLSASLLHPGSDAQKSLPVLVKKGIVELSVPLVRGCALITIKNNGRAQNGPGTRILPLLASTRYPDNRPAARYRLQAEDHGVVFTHGHAPAGSDALGARDVWAWEDSGRYYMHYDGAGARGWLACLATSTNLTDWSPRGAILPFGTPEQPDCASASYGVTYKDNDVWHMFYLGTPHTSPAPDLVPAFPYLTMKAEGKSPTGPWEKRYDITPFRPTHGTYYAATASPGFIVPGTKGYMMFYSASTDNPILRTIGVARTNNLNSAWTIDSKPILPPAEQVENTSLYLQESDKTWFLFTNHVGLRDGLEYTDAIWVYWTKDLEHWNPQHKAVVLDGSSSSWSRQIIGLPSVVRAGNRLALFYDGYEGQAIPPGASSHMNRDVGLAWINLPIIVPSNAVVVSN